MYIILYLSKITINITFLISFKLFIKMFTGLNAYA